MSVDIQLDKPHAYFTNLDVITGKVILTLHGEESVYGVVVKLQGESRTRLARQTQGRPTYGFDRFERFENSQTELEVHKVSR